MGTWILDERGWWFRRADGIYPKNEWEECPWNGVTSWYHFNGEGYMEEGWFTDTDGRIYFLHNVSDNSRGHMYTGWRQIEGRYYFFETQKGSYLGRLYRNEITPDGHRVDENGVWIEEQ